MTSEELLMLKPSVFNVKMDIAKLKRHKSLVFIKSQQKLLKLGKDILTLRSIKLLVLFGIKYNCLRNGRSQLLYLLIRSVIKECVVITQSYNFRTT
jgi:hypothetical protein